MPYQCYLDSAVIRFPIEFTTRFAKSSRCFRKPDQNFMWHLTPLVLLLGTLTGTIQAQLIPAKQVPIPVQQALRKLHPAVQHLQWERAAPYYEAIFTLNQNHRAIKFDVKGQVAETEVGIPITSLPPVISTYIKPHYPNERMQAAETVTKANGSMHYEIRITGMEVVFDKAGTYIEEEKD